MGWNSYKFYERVSFGCTDECWPWTGAQQSNGYGYFIRSNERHLAHRYAFSFFNERESAAECICHSCDNRLCVNPAHLFEGTKGDNNRDRHAKGRSRGGSMPGASNPRAKIDWPAVTDIRKKEKTRQKYADQYGISHWTVRDIQQEKIWRTQSSNTRTRV